MKRRFQISVLCLFLGTFLCFSARGQAQSSPNERPQSRNQQTQPAQSAARVPPGTAVAFPVTAVDLKADNPRTRGVCPLEITFHGSITTRIAATVTYVFTGSDGSRSPVQTLVFRAAGTQMVSTAWRPTNPVASPYLGSETIEILSPNQLRSSTKTGSFTLTCTNATQSGSRGLFRVVLNGFTVNHESDDDILEGDGRGDEIFITNNLWVAYVDGTDMPFRQTRTSVMGDTNGHPGRVLAGSGTPGSGVLDGGLRTGDSYPTNVPWRRVREPFSDRPPVVLWQGNLTSGQDMVVIAPVIWEWDSDDISISQSNVNSRFPNWFEHNKSHLTSFIGQAWPDGRNPTFGAYPIRLDGKAGTRPIGYREAGTSPPYNTSESDVDYLGVVGVFLTYESASKTALAVNRGVHGLVELHYIDASDNGNYTLYLQVERLDGP